MEGAPSTAGAWWIVWLGRVELVHLSPAIIDPGGELLIKTLGGLAYPLERNRKRISHFAPVDFPRPPSDVAQAPEPQTGSTLSEILFDQAREDAARWRARVVELEKSLDASSARCARVAELLAQNGCDCDCDHHHEEHDDDCERCLGCRVSDALQPKVSRD